MNISKSMFKNLSRCKDFASIYDMYIFRNDHHVKEIHGFDVSIGFAGAGFHFDSEDWLVI